MPAIKYSIVGSDYIGAFVVSTDKYAFIGGDVPDKKVSEVEEVLRVKAIRTSIMGSDLIGIFAKANSKGIIFPATTSDIEIEAIKSMGLGINIGVLDTDMNALGNNILVNDKIAFINPDYNISNARIIEDVFDVETARITTGSFKTLGANNLLTNRGLVVNNNITDEEKDMIDSMTGFKSVRSTANFGSLSVGLAATANSNGVISGESTTGYELERIRQGLDIED
ncbi:translation initiation factor aIF6 [Candidatus Mancarchaeum acidiphilum]|uniref:Translation initiation factor aIF6 n=1 Tax=Candidatus Mancarchaeum acidiphilum TaxID=1920749 RepID=A0A218NP05_9ARCH|nr:translation initiation factor IF-6 [Candidatus Mancarchaeum acidiphilum]ASI14208.1 translation initiation factor aIF6 [Candidatus Mancarchaeum acidiphilum]